MPGIVAKPLREDGSAILVDLASGVVSPIPHEPDRAFVSPLWVDERDIWLLGARLVPSGRAGYPREFVKVSRAQLALP